MSDLISRQAVIEAIETDCSWDMFNEWGARTPTGENIINAIKSVPSVEPKKCGDCISREAAIQAVTHFDDTLKRLYELPPVEPERKVGHWIEHEWAEELDGYLISNFECDKCHAWAGADYDYCPNCGVKMEGGNGTDI